MQAAASISTALSFQRIKPLATDEERRSALLFSRASASSVAAAPANNSLQAASSPVYTQTP